MTAALGYAAASLLFAIAVLAGIDTAVRVAARRHERTVSRLGPAAETAIGEYLAGDARLPWAEGKAERAVLFRAAVEALGDLRGGERDRLADMLDRLGFVGEARSRLCSRRRAARRSAAETLAVIGTSSALAAVRPALADRDVLVRTTVARLLAEAGDDEAALAVAAVAEHDVELAPGAVAAVVLTLGQSKPAALGRMLRPGVSAPLKAIAITVAGDLRLASCGPALQASLADDDAISAAAATGLGRIGETMAVPALIELACDESRSANVRTAAASALGAVADPAAAPALGALLSADDWSLRNTAARGLAELGGDGLATLRIAAGSARPEVREPARAGLAWGDDPPEPPAVLARGDDPPEPPAVLARGDDPPEPPAVLPS